MQTSAQALSKTQLAFTPTSGAAARVLFRKPLPRASALTPVAASTMTIEVGDWLSKPSTGVLPPCGVFVEGGEKPIPVPLKRRDVSATVYAAASFSDTKETLSYVSDVECSAVFRFPLPPRAAVYRCVPRQCSRPRMGPSLSQLAFPVAWGTFVSTFPPMYVYLPRKSSLATYLNLSTACPPHTGSAPCLETARS